MKSKATKQHKEYISYVTTGIVMRQTILYPDGSTDNVNNITLDEDTTNKAFEAARQSLQSKHIEPPILGGCTSPIKSKYEYVSSNGIRQDLSEAINHNQYLAIVKSVLKRNH